MAKITATQHQMVQTKNGIKSSGITWLDSSASVSRFNISLPDSLAMTSLWGPRAMKIA